MKNYRVIGYPIGHSMSPFIHKELFSIKGFSADYDKLEVAPENLSEDFDTVLKKLDGFNVTIPHKVNIIRHLDRLDASAAEYGAVNTVANLGGEFVGYNTDACGFLAGLRICGIDLKGEVLVYGYGGAARTIITEALKAGCEVTIGTTKQFYEGALPIAAEFSEKFGKKIKILTDEDITEHYDLLVNATPLGMYPKIDAMPLTEDKINLFDAVYDIVYNPEETRLLRVAKEKGKKCGGGLSMLVAQAAKAHEYFYGAEFSEDEVLEIIEKTAAEQERIFKKNNLVLCGFMGSGKTTVGTALSERLGMELIDTDSEIEKRENRTISEIFASDGEPYFRKKETELIKELMGRENCIISLGGGLAANRENHPYLRLLGKVILLDCGIEETLKRIENDPSRPLTAKGREDIITRYNLRAPIYEAVADLVVDSSIHPEKTLNIIINLAI